MQPQNSKLNPAVLVTGGTGFLGSYLIRYLVKDGFTVRALVRAASDRSLLAEAKDKVEWVRGDVLDIPSLEDAFAGVEKVYHAASMVSFDPKERKKMMKVNVEGTANVVNLALAHGIKKLLYVSSSSTLRNESPAELIDETAEKEKKEPDTYYGISKLLGEGEAWRGIAEGLNVVIVNPTLLLGAGRWTDSSVKIFDAVARGQLFYPVGATGYADVRDAAKIMIRLMESEITGERFIISAENRTYKDVIFKIADQLAVSRPAFVLKNWLNPAGIIFDWLRSAITGSSRIFTSEVAAITSRSVGYDNHKIKQLLKYEFTPVANTIAETIIKYKFSRDLRQSYAVLDI